MYLLLNFPDTNLHHFLDNAIFFDASITEEKKFTVETKMIKQEQKHH